MGKPKFPVIVRRGHTIVKIYHTPSNGSDQFTVSYYLGEKRQRKTFADLGLATTEAETVATKLSQGELNVLELKGEDRMAHVRAVETLKPTGIPLELAAIYIAEMHKILEGRNPVEAARYFVKHHPKDLPRKTVPDVVEELLRAKEADKVSDVYLKALRVRLGRFKQAFSETRISQVTTTEIDRFLRELTVEEKLATGEIRKRPASPKSRNHFRAAIGTLFYFAESRGYVAKGVIDLESVAVAKQKPSEIDIYRPEELIRILAAADDTMIAFLTIGAFAGVRHAEIQRLDWSEVRLDDGFIELKAGKAKTAARRLVPISDNLKQWLKPFRKEQGMVCKQGRMWKKLVWLSERVNRTLQHEQNSNGETHPALPSSQGGNGKPLFEWKHNALRHSFISYRVAETQNVAQTALEAGNSPRVVFSNYRELVRPADAETWFGITPKTVQAWKKAQAKRMAKAAERLIKVVPRNVLALASAAGE
jgi:integrase